MVALLWLVLGVSVGAQDARIFPKTNSPYSRLGLGDPLNEFYASQAGMAGMTAAFRDAFHLNILNPASLASLRATAFEMGLYGRLAGLQEGDQNSSVSSGNLSYMALGFPLINPINQALDRRETPLGIGMMFSLQEKTQVGYNIETTVDSGNEEIGTTSNLFKGQGGLYQLYWGNGIRYKTFSAGFRLGYLFGKTSSNARVEFDSIGQAWATEFLDEISYSGLTWSIGLQYTHQFKKPDNKGEMAPTGKNLTMGLYGNTQNSFNTRSSLFYQRNNRALIVSDTVLFDDNARGDGRLPTELTLGVMYEDTDKLRFGFEVGIATWSQYRNDARPLALSNTRRVAVGGEFIPDVLSYNNYFDKVRYRFGLFYQDDPRSIGGSQLREYGLTVGFGFPIIMPRQQTSFINFAIEAGQFGLSDYIQETFVQMTLGFTLNDNTWFFKRKFN